MADFSWFQAKANEAGLVMCMLCFDSKPRDEMQPVADEPGKVWDVCKECAANERAALEAADRG